jgi:LPS export ABC transporter protein LptC
MNNSNPLRSNKYLAALLGCFFLFACENREGDIRTWTDKVVMKETAIDITSYLSQNGVMKARLVSPLMVRVNADTIYVEFPNGLHCDFYDSTKNVETWLDAKYGKYYENHNRVYLKDSVVVITVKGDTLRSPDLWWDQNTKMFYTDQYAVYKGVGRTIFGGKGLEATQDLTRITFRESTGNMKVSANGFPE